MPVQWAVPQYSKSQVNTAGALVAKLNRGDSETFQLLDDGDIEQAYEIVNNWRSSHAFPLNTIQNGLRVKGRTVDPGCIVAQRIKRLASIELKLDRFPTMTLSQMQDLGGCRGIVSSVPRVDRLATSYRKSDVRHELHTFDDYIRNPKPSGYRGVHMIYRYRSDRSQTYNGLKIEMQLRSQLQHAWATAVETVGTFIRQALKSSRGEDEWLRFFALMGSAIARRERTSLIPDTPNKATTLKIELRKLAKKLDVAGRLNAYGAALNALEEPSAKRHKTHYYLLELNPAREQTRVTGFARGEIEAASARYLEAEKALKSSEGSEAVLVSVDSLATLKRAYPNYFLDTEVFIREVNRALR